MFVFSSPFSVPSDRYHLSADSCMRIVIGLLPLKTGEHTGYLRVHYDTGMSQKEQNKFCSQTS